MRFADVYYDVVWAVTAAPGTACIEVALLAAEGRSDEERRRAIPSAATLAYPLWEVGKAVRWPFLALHRVFWPSDWVMEEDADAKSTG